MTYEVVVGRRGAGKRLSSTFCNSKHQAVGSEKGTRRLRYRRKLLALPTSGLIEGREVRAPSALRSATDSSDGGPAESQETMLMVTRAEKGDKNQGEYCEW